MLFFLPALYVFFVLMIVSNELTASGVEITADVPAVFNSDEWVLVQAEAAGSVLSDLPPKASTTWKDPDAEIFVSIVEYRDSRCPLTLKNLFSNAENPKRIYIGEENGQ